MTTSASHMYRVLGMNCGHCRSSVLEEVEEIVGVRNARLDLDSGRLEFEGTDVTSDQVRSAVERAGYELEEAV